MFEIFFNLPCCWDGELIWTKVSFQNFNILLNWNVSLGWSAAVEMLIEYSRLRTVNFNEQVTGWVKKHSARSSNGLIPQICVKWALNLPGLTLADSLIESEIRSQHNWHFPLKQPIHSDRKLSFTTIQGVDKERSHQFSAIVWTETSNKASKCIFTENVDHHIRVPSAG